MTFPRVKPGGWGVNEKFTSTQGNQLDIDHVAAVDGSGLNGDSVYNIGATKLQFQGTATRSVAAGFASPFKSTNFAPNSQGNQQASATAGSFEAVIRGALVDGGTIASVTLYFKFSTGRAGLPATFPKFSVFRVDRTTAGAGVSLNSGDGGSGLAITAAGNVTTYEAGGAVQSFVYTCNQDNVIDLSKYEYIASLTDESGTNSQNGNLYSGCVVGLSAIADLRSA